MGSRWNLTHNRDIPQLAFVSCKVEGACRTAGFRPPSVTYRRATAAAAKEGEQNIVPRNAAHHDLKVLLQAAEREGIASKLEDIVACNAAIRTLGKAGDWKGALHLLKSIQSAGLSPDHISYTCVINTCGRAGQVDTAFSLFEDMTTRGIDPTTATYNAIIRLCNKRSGVRSWRRAVSLLSELRLKGLEPDSITYAHVVKACVRGATSGGPDSKEAACIALSVLKDMQESNMIMDGRTLAGGVAAASTLGDGKAAAELMTIMKSKAVEMGASVYRNGAIACGKAGQWKESVDILTEARDLGLTVGTRAYTSALTACAKHGRWEEALNILQVMRGYGGTEAPDMVAYTITAAACRAANRHQEALALLSWAKEDGLHISGQFALGLLQCAAQCEHDACGADVALLLLNALEADDSVNDIKKTSRGGSMPPRSWALRVGYTLAATALGKEGRWEDALSLSQRMKDTHGPQATNNINYPSRSSSRVIVPDAHFYSALMTACGRAGRWQEALNLLDTMADDGVPVTCVSYGVAAAACKSSGRWKECLALISEMKAKSIRPDAKMYTAVLNTCATAAASEKQVTLEVDDCVSAACELALTASAEGVSTPHVWNAALTVCERGGDFSTAEKLFHAAEKAGQIDGISYILLAATQRKGGDPRGALTTLRSAAPALLPPTAVELEIAILGQLGKRQEALSIWEGYKQKCVKNGHQAPASAWLAAMRTAGSDGNWKVTRRMMQEATSLGVSLGNAGYVVLAEAICFAPEEWEAGVGLLEEMKFAGLVCDVEVVSPVVKACLAAERWTEAFDIAREAILQSHDFHSMRSGGHIHTSSSLATLAFRACAGGGLCDEAIDLVEVMQTAGLALSRHQWALAAASEARAECHTLSGVGDMPNVSRVEVLMNEAGVEVGVDILNALMAAYCSAGLWRRVLELFARLESMPDPSPDLSPTTALSYLQRFHSHALQAASSLGSGSATLRVTESMRKRLGPPHAHPPPALIIQAIRALSATGVQGGSQELLSWVTLEKFEGDSELEY